MDKHAFITELTRLGDIAKDGEYTSLSFDFVIEGMDYSVEVELHRLPDHSCEHVYIINAFTGEKIKTLEQIKFKSDITYFKTLEEHKNTAKSYLLLTLAMIRASETEE